MRKTVKDPIGIIFGSLQFMESMINGDVEKIRETAINTKLTGFEVDTADTVDCGWETGIKPEGGVWIIVARYPNSLKAAEGHAYWIKKVTEHPKTELRDINYDYEEN